MRLRHWFQIVLTASVALAQTNRGGISGNVTDQSGAVVPSAAVVIINAGTNETRRLTTSDKGTFILENLDPVTYRIEALAPGFKKAVLEDVKVDTSTVVTANLILQTGDVSTEVTVSANAAVVNTESGTLGQTISSRMLDDTPLPTRSVLDLAITVGNVTGDVGSSDPQLGSGTPLPGFNLQAKLSLATRKAPARRHLKAHGLPSIGCVAEIFPLLSRAFNPA